MTEFSLVDAEQGLIEGLAKYRNDPLGFTYWNWSWGEAGTELASAKGPQAWQREVLKSLGEGLLTIDEAILIARASGHGIGKSALVAWIICWALFTMVDTKGVVTANTENQLKTKTWAEVAVWHRRSLCADMFKFTATALFSRDPKHERTWRMDMIPWSEKNTEAFAGMHNKGKRILIVFDEASAIHDTIWEVSEGALTDEDTQIIWCAFGNPTRNTGRFRECFAGGRFAHRWDAKQIDSRTVRITNKSRFEKWIEDWGEDSDFIKVRVRGMFPSDDGDSFITLDEARGAIERTAVDKSTSVVLGVDVGRGGDASVIYPRQGRDASSRPPKFISTPDTMILVREVLAAMTEHSAKLVFVDGGGVGGPVVDRLRQLGVEVIDVQFGARADGCNLNDGRKYANKRAEIYGAVKDWLALGSIENWDCGENLTFEDELVATGYGENIRDQIQLELKSIMRRRGVPSPNCLDALATTFAMPHMLVEFLEDIDHKVYTCPDYNPYDRERLMI